MTMEVVAVLPCVGQKAAISESGFAEGQSICLAKASLSVPDWCLGQNIHRSFLKSVSPKGDPPGQGEAVVS